MACISANGLAIRIAASATVVLGCGDATSGPESGETEGSAVSTTDGATGNADTVGDFGDDDSDDGDSDSGDGGGDGETGASVPSCPAPDEPIEPEACSVQAPANAFDPAVEWAWDGQDGYVHSLVTPLVANMTDDNGDGAIDLCDRPDVIVVAYPAYGDWWDGRLFVLDGATGAVELWFETPVWALTTPAIGDVDHDGRPEIVTADGLGPFPIVFEHDGSIKWRRDETFLTGREAVALADLGGDGEIEAIIGREIFRTRDGHASRIPRLVDADSTTTAADLDGDGRLDVTIGWAAWSVADDPHGGELGSGFELLYENDDVKVTSCPGSGIAPGDPTQLASVAPGVQLASCPENACIIDASGHPHVANLDADPEPEILLTDEDGLSVLEHDGTTKYAHLRPTGVLGVADGTNCDHTNWLRPAAVHPALGATVGIVATSGDAIAGYDGTLSVLGSGAIVDPAGMAGTTAFDFLGDGSAELLHADENALRVLDLSGATVFEVPRTSVTLIEVPVVADVDDDGSAEIVVVSNGGPGEAPGAPTVQVIGDAQDRWVPTRRIWNQHTYHVTNVREDGTIPQMEPPHHQGVNVFRANVQVENGVSCTPNP